MKLSLAVPNNQRVTTLRQPWQDEVGGAEIREMAGVADRLGFARLTVGEHFMIPESHVAASGSHYMHATTALAYLGGNTRQIRLASNVSLVALQHPIVAAKQWAVLDWLTGGRADLIVGVGWLKEEFDVLGVDFRTRGRRLDEDIEAMLEIWTSDSATYRGEFVEFEGVASEPKPIKPTGVPLWFAGDVTQTLARVAKWGVGWSPYLTPPDKIAEGIDSIKSHADYRNQEIEVYFNLANLRLKEGHVGKEDDHDFDTWNVQKLVDQIWSMAELGVTEVAPPTPKLLSYQHYLERLHWLAEEIMPRIR